MSLTPTQQAALAAELTNDPLTRGYAGMSNAAAAADLRTAYRDLPLSAMSGDEVFSVTVAGEYNLLSDTQKQLWLAFCGRTSIDPFGAANVAFVQSLFGGGSATVSALAALRTVANGQSRAQELGFAGVDESDVQEARA